MRKGRFLGWWALVALFVLFVGCESPGLLSAPTPTPAPACFTYSTYDGAVWQIDVDGGRVRLLAPDGIHKWRLAWSDDRRWLAYVGLGFPEPGVRTETLFVVDREGENVREIAGPHRSIHYEWEDTRHVRLGVADVLTPDRPQEREWFLADVETGALVEVEEEWAMPTPPPEPRLLESPNGQWTVQSEREGARRAFYLLDRDGNRISLIYEQPADAEREFTMWSRDSQWFLYMPLDSDDPYYGDLYLYHPASLSSRQLTNYKGEQGWPATMSYFEWSPNGEWLLFSLTDSVAANQLCVVRFGDAPDLRCFDVRWKANLFVWSSDSRFVAFLASVETDLYVLDVVSGEVRNLTNDGSAQVEDYITAY